MCSGSKSEACSLVLSMEGEIQGKEDCKICSKLLELSAVDDVAGFISEVEVEGCDLNKLGFWYGRRIGSKKMGFDERTPLLIASMYGSIKVLKYIIGTGKLDVNKAYGLDGVTALHCAAAGGSESAVEVVKLLIEAAADINSIDANGNKPGDLVALCFRSLTNSKTKTLEIMLKGIKADAFDLEEEQAHAKAHSPKEGTEKREYLIDVSLPDINNGLYGTDDFRMYNFKVKPCSRAYSHDWTECPFVHPGENARRRDPRKYHYSCVPCPDFKKGTCSKGDSCEYAHGIFESWLHPAQYRTRLCKDETGCSRKVCFFAHSTEELRPLYASTGSAMPSPPSSSVNSMDIGSLSPMALGSPSLFVPTSSTPPMSPSVMCSSPMATSIWQNKINPPALQLPGSRLKTTWSARDVDLEMDFLSLESIRTRQAQRQQVIDEMASLSSPSAWSTDYTRIGDLKPTNFDDVFGSPEPTMLSHFQCRSPKIPASKKSQLQSPTGLQIHQHLKPLRASYPSNISSSPARKSSALACDTSSFANQSQSFIDRGAMNHLASVTSAANSPTSMPSNYYDWGSPEGKLNWGFNSDDLSKLRNSASFAHRNGNVNAAAITLTVDEPDVSWVHSLVKDGSKHGSILDKMPSWIDQMYIEQEQMVA